MGLWDFFKGFGDAFSDWGGSQGFFGLGGSGSGWGGQSSFTDSFKGLDLTGFPAQAGQSSQSFTPSYGGSTQAQGQNPQPQTPNSQIPSFDFSRWWSATPSSGTGYRSGLAGLLSPALTGKSIEELTRGIATPSTQFPLSQIQGAYPQADKRMHAYSSYLMGDKWGRPMARTVGGANEILSLLAGGGIDDTLQDLSANEMGLLLLNQFRNQGR